MKDYNFFSIYSKRRKQGIDFHSPYVIGLSIVAIFVLLTVGVAARNMFMGKNIQAMRTEVDAIKASDTFIEADKLRINIQAMEQYDKNAQVVLDAFQEAKILGTSFLQQVAGAVPAGIVLDNITANSSVVQIICTVPTRKAAAEFQLYLKELPLFQNVHMDSIILKEGTGLIAGIECVIRRAGEEQ